jgi:hypothetical protein
MPLVWPAQHSLQLARHPNSDYLQPQLVIICTAHKPCPPRGSWSVNGGLHNDYQAANSSQKPCMPGPFQVYKVMLDGVQPMAAKCLRLGEEPKLAGSFLKVGLQCLGW